MRDQSHIPPIADFVGSRTAWQNIINRAGGDGTTELEHRFEQRRFEGKNRGAIGTRSFGKQDDERIVGNSFADAIDRSSSGDSAMTIDEDGSSGVRQPAKQRPDRDLSFCYENAPADRAEDKDVDITEMIANEETRWWHRTAKGQPDTEDATC